MIATSQKANLKIYDLAQWLVDTANDDAPSGLLQGVGVQAASWHEGLCPGRHRAPCRR